jgi:RimJ/RimL family protein N-acetyltransferase
MESDGIFTFRRARPDDKEQVSRLCAKIWEGDDYIPRCFDEWVADQDGELSLCFVGEDLAGISKLSWMGPGDAWLEGLRKDPDLTVKGVGAALSKRYLTRLAHKESLRSIRFSTYFANHASIKLNEGMGFQRIATASFKEMDADAMKQRLQEPPTGDPRISMIRDAATALAFVQSSGWFGDFIHQAWRSYPWSENFFIHRYLEPGHCLGLLDNGQLKAMAVSLIDPMKGEGSLPFFDAVDAASAEALLETVERRLAHAGVPTAAAIIPPGGTRANGFLSALGWHTWEQEEDYFVYEFPLELLSRYRTVP